MDTKSFDGRLIGCPPQISLGTCIPRSAVFRRSKNNTGKENGDMAISARLVCGQVTTPGSKFVFCWKLLPGWSYKTHLYFRRPGYPCLQNMVSIWLQQFADQYGRVACLGKSDVRRSAGINVTQATGWSNRARSRKKYMSNK